MSSRTDARTGAGGLPSHLRDTYGVDVAGIEQLDLGTYRVDRGDGPAWVVRVFPAERPAEWARGDAEILALLAERDYPAERCATSEPVSALHGQALLVTELVPSVPRSERKAAIAKAGGLAALGERLGRLHELERPRGGAACRPGGAWHHLADGSPAAELAALRALLDEAEGRVAERQRPMYDSLREAVSGLDDGEGLPESLIHPDFALPNVIASSAGELVIVDWAGAGLAPRMWSLAFLLWAVGYGGDLRRVDRVVAGYRARVQPEREELERLEALTAVRPTVFDAWAFATGRKSLADAARSARDTPPCARAIAHRACEAFAAR